MGSAAVALIAFAVVIGASFTVIGDLAGISASSADALRASWKEAEQIVDSNVTPVDVDTTVTVLITDVDVTIENNGRLKYTEADFPDWEVIVRYQDTLGVEQVEYIEYGSSVAAGFWTVEGIYTDASTSTAEIYEPGIFNPSEEMVITARLIRILGVGTVNQVTISPPEGPRKSIHFDG